MAVDYPTGNDRPTADLWNLLFADANRKIAAALDNKSFFVSGETSLAGHIFCFANGPRPYTASLGDSYDHAFFEGVASAATELSRDEELQIMDVTGADGHLHNSLEAHTRSGYYLRDSGAAFATTEFPEKIYKYAVAELAYEGIGFSGVLFPRRYNKYNFFRIHNLNYYAMQFRFDGGPTYNIPPLGCLCVRRDTVTTGYNSQWAYLWPMESGDPRFFLMMATQNGLTAGSGAARPINSMIASNVSNPAAIYSWFNLLTLTGIGGGKWHPDPHVYHDVSSYYCPTYFPLPSDTTQPIGNFFHHKGVIAAGENRCTFNGYQTITGDIPELAISSLSDDAITFTPTANLTAITTNLLSSWSASNPEAESGVDRTLDSTNTGRSNIAVVEVTETEISYTTVTLLRGVLTVQSVVPLAGTISFHKDTLSEILTLNPWGVSDYNDSAQDTNANTISDRNLRLTPLGPRITFTQTIAFDGSYWGGSASGVGLLDDIYAEASSGQLTRKGFVQFSGFGWPELETVGDAGELLPPNIVSNPAHLSPRHPRAYSGYIVEGGANLHPNIANGIAGPAGQDFDVTTIGDNYQEKEFAFLATVELQPVEDTLDTNWRKWKNPDSLVTDPMIRVPLLREHYNAMAMVINSVRRVTPLGFSNIRIAIQVTPGEWEIHGVPPANNNGVLGGYCPASMFASFAKDGAEHKACVALGIPIKTEADLPEDYHTARATLSHPMHVKMLWEDEVVSVDSMNGTFVAKHTSLGPRLESVGPPAPAIAEAGEFYWVTISDVKQVVESLGWAFTYRGTFTLHEIALASFRPSMEYSAGASKTETFPFPPFPAPDPNVGDTFRGFYPVLGGGVPHFSVSGIFVNSGEGEWKLPAAQPAVVDATPAGWLTPEVIFDPQFNAYSVFFFKDQDEGVLLATGRANDALGGYTKHVLAQNYFTGDLTNGSKAMLVSVDWARHVDTDVSIPSYADSIAYHFSGVQTIPLQAIDRTGTETEAIGSGDTVFSFEPDKAIEIVPLWRVYADVD